MKKKVVVVKHVVLHHLSTRRLEWAFTLGAGGWILFYLFHVEIFKVIADLMTLPAMEAFLSRTSGLE